MSGCTAWDSCLRAGGAEQAVGELVDGYVSKMDKLVTNAVDARRLTSAGAAAGGFLGARDGGHGPSPGNVGSTAKLAELLWQNLTEVCAPASSCRTMCGEQEPSEASKKERATLCRAKTSWSCMSREKAKLLTSEGGACPGEHRSGLNSTTTRCEGIDLYGRHRCAVGRDLTPCTERHLPSCGPTATGC